MKVYTLQLEDEIGALDPEWVIWQWMARWAAMAYNRYQHGSDGRTAYQRQTGRMCRHEVLPFGEKVLFRLSKKSGDKKDVMDSKWREGIWLGQNRSSNESLVGTPDGVFKTWTIRRLIK